jgi:hypothetical protein
MCDRDRWTVNGHPVRSYSKQVKAGALAVKTRLQSYSSELRGEYVEVVVVFVDPRSRVRVNRATVVVVRFSELLPLIAGLASKRQM